MTDTAPAWQLGFGDCAENRGQHRTIELGARVGGHPPTISQLVTDCVEIRAVVERARSAETVTSEDPAGGRSVRGNRRPHGTAFIARSTRCARHHVHLSADPDTAVAVGSRRGQHVVLAVDSAAMHAAGHVFYRSANGVWLTDEVPARYLVDGDLT